MSTLTATAPQTAPHVTGSSAAAQVQPYLNFDGRCDEAIEYYQRTLGAELVMRMRFKESPVPGTAPENAEKVMHAAIRIGATEVMLSDGHCQGRNSFAGFSLSLVTRTVGDTKRLFNALADGGTVQMPVAETFFSPAFGMVTDRFGISWMLYLPASRPGSN